jgi:hypothetical protein
MTTLPETIGQALETSYNNWLEDHERIVLISIPI